MENQETAQLGVFLRKKLAENPGRHKDTFVGGSGIILGSLWGAKIVQKSPTEVKKTIQKADEILDETRRPMSSILGRSGGMRGPLGRI